MSIIRNALVLCSILVVTSAALVLRFERNNKNHEKQPSLWQQVPNELADFPTSPDGTLIDPWNYKDRLGLLRILMRKTRDYATRFETDNSGNPLWGLAQQLGWQFTSGRLSNATGLGCGLDRQRCISSFSWWGGVNYYLSVVPFLAAQRAGYFQDWPFEIRIFYPTFNDDLFCVDGPTCDGMAKEALKRWTEFFEMLKTATDEEAVLAHSWRAHLSSLEVGVRSVERNLDSTSENEREFQLDWAHFIEYVAAAYVKTDLNTTYNFQRAYLPDHVLSVDTSVPETTARSLKLLRYLRKLDLHSGDRMISFWRKATCSRRGRQIVTMEMASHFGSYWRLAWDVTKLAWVRLWETCDRPSLPT